MQFDTARAALRDLTDAVVFERVSVYVLRKRHPELRADRLDDDQVRPRGV